MLDSFASGIHDIELYRSAADTVSSTLLRICSQRLEEREAKNALTSSQLEEEEEEGESLGADSADRNKHTHKRQTKTIDKNSRVRLGKKKQREDIGLVLGALSRVERR
jgi:kinetochore protein Mis13/DSN1